MIHSATAESCAPRALHSVTPSGTNGITRSAPADISWISRSAGSFASTGIRDGGTPKGSTTTSTSPADSGSCSPPVHTSAIIPSGRPPVTATESGSGSHTLIVEDATTPRLPGTLPSRAGALQVPLPRLGHVIGRILRGRLGRADDHDRAHRGTKTGPDHGPRGAVRVWAVGRAAEHQHVGPAGVVEQHARREPFGYLGAHADAGKQADRLGDRSPQHVTGRGPAAAGLPGCRDRITCYLMTRRLQGEHRENLGGTQARLPARPSECGQGLR